MEWAKIRLPLIIIFLLGWQLLLTFQGLDLADTGFHLTSFRFIFDDPYSAQYSMMYWLSDVVGHYWMSVVPHGGLFWARIGWVFFISLTFCFYYLILSRVIGQFNAVIGLGITLIFILLGGPECLNYDVFSTFGIGLGVFVLFRGLVKSSKVLIFVAGALLGTSVFFRLSNLAVLAFFIAIPAWGLIKGKKNVYFGYLSNRNKLLSYNKGTHPDVRRCAGVSQYKNTNISTTLFHSHYLMLFLSGFITGLLFFLFLIWNAGHWSLFVDNLEFMSAMGHDLHSTHGLKPMLISYLKGYSIAFIITAVFLFLSWLFHKAYHPKKTNNLILPLISGFTAFVLTAYWGDIFWSKIRYLFLGLMVFNGLIILTNRKTGNELRLLALLGLLLLFIAPLGSDSGLDKSIWGMWILGPLLIALPEAGWFEGTRLGFGVHNFYSVLRKPFAIVVLATAMVHAWQTPYFDVGSRFDKVVGVNHPDLKMIFTSARRAKTINELVQEGFPKIENERYLLCFVEIPMVNYLSQKTPFLSTPWPKLYYTAEMFSFKLKEALQTRKAFPAIIRQKQNTMLADWPGVPNPDYLNYPENLSKWPDHGKILNKFIAENEYHIVWENDMFQLLVKESDK